MAATLEFFFDFVSPTAYIAKHLAPGAAERAGAELSYRPMFLGGVMKATGNRPPGAVAAKGRYLGEDMARVCERHGIEMGFNPHFPMNTRPLTRAAIGLAADPDAQKRFMDAAWTACWGKGADLKPDDAAAFDTFCESAGFDPARIRALGEDPANKDALRANTEEAVERGAFGAPTFFVGDQMFFGSDRLDYAEEALAAAAAPVR